MSRFANPNLPRPSKPVVIRSPVLPIQRQPGFRYGRGMALPGMSLTGRNFVETNKPVDYSDSDPPAPPRNRSTSPKRNRKATVKKFVKPERQERVQRKAALPITPNVFKLHGAIADHSTSPSTIQQSNKIRPSLEGHLVHTGHSLNRSPGSSVAATATATEVDNYSIPSSSSRVGTRPHSASAAEAWKSPSSIGFSSNSANKFFSPGDHRSSLPPRDAITAYSHAGSGFSVSGCSVSINASLSQSSPPSYAVNNIQLSHGAFKSYRKLCVKDALAQFLHSEQSIIYNKTDQPPSSSSTIPADDGSPASQHSALLQEHKNNEKRRHRLLQMTSFLREAIRDELNEFSNASVDRLFFPSENMHHNFVSATRESVFKIISQWQEQFVDETISALDDCYSAWSNAVEQREAEERNLRAVKDEDVRLQNDLQSSKSRLIALKKRADELGLDVSDLLSSFPPRWFQEDRQQLDLAPQVTSVDKLFVAFEKSVFLSPSGQIT